MGASVYIVYFNKYSDLWKLSNNNILNIRIKEKSDPPSKENCGKELIHHYSHVLQLQYFYNELIACPYFRRLAIHNLRSISGAFVIVLNPDFEYIIDYKWCDMLCLTMLEYIELDHAMSWLSTLGGAFSAYGENSNFHADVAGKISLYQLRLALRIGDPLTVARCKLYFSLALIQKGYLNKAKYLIKKQYIIAKKLEEVDCRLIKMCFGIWSKLKYAQFLREKNSQIRTL